MVGEETETDRRTFLKAAGAAGSAAALAPLASATAGERGRTTPDEAAELTVGVSEPTEFETIEESLPDGAEVVARDENLLFERVRLPSRDGAYGRLRDQSQIARQDGVKFTESNEPIQFLPEPQLVEPVRRGDGRRGGNSDPLFDEQYAPQKVNAPQAQEVAGDSNADVTVAVVDQGVDYDHPDLEAQFGGEKGENLTGTLWMEGDDPAPRGGREFHGTHVGGIVAATANNDEGVTGIAGIDGVRLLSFRALSKYGTGTPFDIAQGIRAAADAGADVINLSVGAGHHFFIIRSAISYAADQGALPVAAAGNASQDAAGYPARLDDCVAVSAIDENDEFAEFSNYGESIDVAAPGVAVLSSMYGDFEDDYMYVSGTSMASPVVAGVAALVKKEYPDLGPDGIRRRIVATADDVGLPEEKQGAGRVNALEAVSAGTIDDTVETTYEGEIDLQYHEDTITHQLAEEGQEEVVVTLQGPGNADFDLYLTLDGREAGEDDHDRKDRTVGPQGRIELDGEEVSDELGISVHAYRETGHYTVTVEEHLDEPTVSVDAAVEPGRPLSFSADVEGDVTWAFDGQAVEGSTVTHAFDDAGEHSVELLVDRGGETVSTQTSLTVSPDARAGGLHAGDAVEGRIAGGSERFVYDTRLDGADQVSLSLASPGNASADLDLYVTLDGRRPTLDDHDLRATSPAAVEHLLVDDPDGPIGVLVDHVAGDRTFRLETDELGTRL